MASINAKTVHVNESAYALLDDNTTKSEWDALLAVLHSDAEMDILKNIEDDYETYNYLLLDCERVVLVFDNDVVREWETVSDFMFDTIAEVERAYFESIKCGKDD